LSELGELLTLSINPGCINTINVADSDVKLGSAGMKKDLEVPNQSYKCSNRLCGRSFEAPLKTIDLSQPNREPYDSCPCCLHEISEETNYSSQTLDEASEGRENQSANAIVDPVPATATGCMHHLGYLSERSAKESIPEECIVCTQILNCMLKTVKNVDS
jgi:hypothetical protein